MCELQLHKAHYDKGDCSPDICPLTQAAKITTHNCFSSYSNFFFIVNLQLYSQTLEFFAALTVA